MKKTPGGIVIKLFVIVINEFSKYARAFDPGKPFRHGLMLGGKAGAYPIQATLKCSTLG
jgi:hypothetical protein